MAALATTIMWDVETGGSDTANGGGFNPGNASFDNTGTINSATTSAPTFSATNYTPVAGDINAWLFIQSGTSTIPGWYQITGVGAGVATLQAAAGTAVLWSSPDINGLNTATGCGTTGTLTSVVWGIDYSRQASAAIPFSDITAVGAGSTFTSTANPVGKNFVGNVIQVTGTGGGNLTLGFYEIISTSTITATVNSAISTGATTTGAGGLGGALLTLGQAGAIHVAGNKINQKAGTFSMTSSTSNVAAGRLTLVAGSNTNVTTLRGYNSIPGDIRANPTLSRPLNQASGIASVTMVTPGALCHFETVTMDCAGLASMSAFGAVAQYTAFRCKAINAKQNGFATVGSFAAILVLCEVTLQTAGTVFAIGSGFACAAYANTVTPFASGVWTNCFAINNTGATTDGFASSAAAITCNNCTAYGNGRAGFRMSGTTTAWFFINCVAEANVGLGFDANVVTDNTHVINCAVYNNNGGTGNVQVSSNITPGNVQGLITNTTSTFFNSPGGSITTLESIFTNFTPNNNVNAGALIRSASIGP